MVLISKKLSPSAADGNRFRSKRVDPRNSKFRPDHARKIRNIDLTCLEFEPQGFIKKILRDFMASLHSAFLRPYRAERLNNH